MHTVILRLEITSPDPIQDALVETLATALGDITREALEDYDLRGKAEAAIVIMGAGEVATVDGKVDTDQLPAPVADALRSRPPKDEYGATAGCYCPSCITRRAAALAGLARWN